MHGAKQIYSYNDNNQNNQNKANQDRARQNVATIVGNISNLFRNRRFRARGLEDYEELSQRDLDDEELEVFGREIDILDERDTFDDLD